MPNSDSISRSALLAAYDAAHKGPPGGARKLIQEAPGVDAVPVVRCKDCIHYNNNYCGDGFGWCERKGIGHETSDDWFCASGEAKEKS